VKKAFIVPFIFLISGIISLYSDQQSATPNRPQITIPKVSVPPKIDGILNDDCWKDATSYSNFVEYEPVDGLPCSEKTEVMMAYDSENFYVAFRCYDRQKNEIRANLFKRDNTRNDDTVTVMLDTFNSQRRAYSIASNPLGIQEDGMYTEGKGTDSSIDIIYDSEGKLNEDGYAVEMAIPFKSLRFPQGESHTIGFGAFRKIVRHDEQSSWPSRDMNKNTLLDQMALIRDLQGIAYSKNIEILPSFTATQSGEINSNGAFENQPTDSDFGIGLKYGITPNITLDFAYNPDFSQVEADQGQVDVNLRYELYFEEKRPFFLEGADIFTLGEISPYHREASELETFYSRRIIDPLYGAKITGKVGRTTFGFISSLDEGPGRPWYQEGNPYIGERALFNIARAKFDLFRNSYVGFMMTSRKFAHESNNVVGIDGSFNFKRKYNLNFKGFGSFTTIEDGQKLKAPAYSAEFSRNSRHLDIKLSYLDLYRDFRADAGFIKRTDIKKTSSSIGYRFMPNKSWLLVAEPALEFNRYYDHNGIMVEDNFSPAIDFTFPRDTSLDISFDRGMERWQGIDFDKSSFSLGFRSSPSKYYYLGIEYNIGKSIYYSTDYPYLGYGSFMFAYFTLRPIRQIKAELELRKSTFWKERGGDLVYDYNIIYTKTTYQFSKQLFLRAIAEYNDYWKKVYTDILFSYMYNYGTVFFLGYGSLFEREYDSHRNEYLDFRQNQRSFFIKISYLWRL
jgi:hypothetical protein